MGTRRRDLVDQVSGDPNITVVSHFATANGIMRSTSAIRRSTTQRSGEPCSARSIKRKRCRRLPAVIGTTGCDDIGLFRTGSPLASDVGIEVLRSPRDYAAVKRALSEAGYKGEKIVVIVPTDVSELGNLTRTGAEQLRHAGMNVDLQEMDFGSVVGGATSQGRRTRAATTCSVP